jgi:LysR family glycine cleavage system transcriptional activator
MTHRPPPIALLHTFEVAARHLSFKKAAVELHVTPAAVSQQIRTLEERLGGPLFVRLTRALRLSERGAAMLPQVRAGLAGLSQAIRLGQETTARARRSVRLVAPPSFATHWLLPRLPRFYAAHAGIEVQLSSTSATVDHPGDDQGLAMLEPGADDAAGTLVVLYGNGSFDPARFAADVLMTPDYVPVCTPALAAAIHAPADLLRQVLLHDDTFGVPGDPAAWGWPQWLAAAGVRSDRPKVGPRFSNAVLALEAALAGQGVALAPRPLVSAHLGSGALQQPFATALRSPWRYQLVGKRTEAERTDVAGLRAWLLAEAATAHR